jgi:hypothetical protein
MNLALVTWQQAMKEHLAPTILVTGAKHWEGSPVDNHSANAPHGKWIGTDIYSGDGVDIVLDLCNIGLSGSRFHGIFSPSTLEHVNRPWLAVNSMAKALLPNGHLFMQTHQTFPLHGYPHDYFRFSTEALHIMAVDAGYEYPCTIIPPPEITRWNAVAPSHLNVCMFASMN